MASAALTTLTLFAQSPYRDIPKIISSNHFAVLMLHSTQLMFHLPGNSLCYIIHLTHIVKNDLQIVLYHLGPGNDLVVASPTEMK